MMGMRCTVCSVCVMGVGDKRHSHGAALLVQYMQLNQHCTHTDPHLVASSLVSKSNCSQFNPDDGIVVIMR